MNKKLLLLSLLILAISMMLSGCMAGDGSYSNNDPAGFLSGIWHGWIAPISLIRSIFNPSIRVYEPINTGWWYDFGFYAAVISGFGGISLSRKKHKD